MSEQQRPIEESLDQELGLRGIAVFAIGILVLIIVAGALMWPLSTGLRDHLEDQDPEPPRLLEARWQQPPPEPRLQPDPARELEAHLAEQEVLTNSYAWVNEAAGIVRVPVDRAIELALEKGLPEPTAEAVAEDEKP